MTRWGFTQTPTTKRDQSLSLPGRTARYTLRLLRRLAQLTPPRVVAATFSTLLNRWTTTWRMRSLHATATSTGQRPMLR